MKGGGAVPEKLVPADRLHLFPVGASTLKINMFELFSDLNITNRMHESRCLEDLQTASNCRLKKSQ